MTVEYLRTTATPPEALGGPSLGMLAYCLRHPETWPEDFTWNYDYCDECAMGLAWALWGGADLPAPESYFSWTLRMFAIGYESAEEIFQNTRAPRTWRTLYRRPGREFTTPEMVASAIETYLRGCW